MSIFNEFLKTGNLGPLHIGQTLDTVVNILGEPPLTAKSKPDSDIFKYGDVEVTAESKTLRQIKVCIDIGIPEIPDSLSPEVWPIHEHTTLEEGLDLIDAAEVTWQLHEKRTYFRHLCFVVESGVLLYYDLSFRGFQSVSISTLS